VITESRENTMSIRAIWVMTTPRRSRGFRELWTTAFGVFLPFEFLVNFVSRFVKQEKTTNQEDEILPRDPQLSTRTGITMGSSHVVKHLGPGDRKSGSFNPMIQVRKGANPSA